MVKRTVCLCDGKTIGIETIYEVKGSKQINIKDKVEQLRAKSRNNELFCPCGCGANLILVAGDKNLKEQHFRMKNSKNEDQCYTANKNITATFSKIVLRCWLEEKLGAEDVRTRVPISSVEDSDRKYEFSILQEKRGIAISYCFDRTDLSDEKLKILQENSTQIGVIYIVDVKNGRNGGQYPEWLMKVQKRQAYCLLLKVENDIYMKAELEAIFYAKDIDGLWAENSIAKGPLYKFEIEDNGEVLFNGVPLKQLQKKCQEEFDKRIQKEECKRKEKEERKETERRKAENDYGKESEQQKTIVNPEKPKQYTCKFCGETELKSNFYIAPIRNKPNFGVCNKCKDKYIDSEKKKDSRNGEKSNAFICPECGGLLIKKSGRYGDFMGCKNFPECRFSYNIKN